MKIVNPPILCNRRVYPTIQHATGVYILHFTSPPLKAFGGKNDYVPVQNKTANKKIKNEMKEKEGRKNKI